MGELNNLSGVRHSLNNVVDRLKEDRRNIDPSTELVQNRNTVQKVNMTRFLRHRGGLTRFYLFLDQRGLGTWKHVDKELCAVQDCGGCSIGTCDGIGVL